MKFLSPRVLVGILFNGSVALGSVEAIGQSQEEAIAMIPGWPEPLCRYRGYNTSIQGYATITVPLRNATWVLRLKTHLGRFQRLLEFYNVCKQDPKSSVSRGFPALTESRIY